MPDLPSPPKRSGLVQGIPRRAGVAWWLGILLAVSFAVFTTPVITAERWLMRFHEGTVTEQQAAPFTIRAPMFAGYDHLRVGGGVVVARGEVATRDEASIADAIAEAMPRGKAIYLAFLALTFALAAIFSHHMRRSTKGRLARVQIVSLAVLGLLAVAVKIVLLSTALSALVVPVAALAMVPTMVLDRVVGIATGVFAALVVSLLAPFDVGLAILLLVQAAIAGLVVAERPRRWWTAALTAGLATTTGTSAIYLLLTYLTTGHAPQIHDPLHSPWVAAAIGPTIAAVISVPLIPVYQLLVGEITQGKLFALEDLGHPLLRQIAEKSPGTWQHSLMMANMAEIAANAIGANGRLVRVGAYFHDLGKSLQPKYFIENLEAGETSPHDQLPPEVSCDAIFAHVTEGIVRARKARLHERIIDFMHMHHGDGVLEYFWARCREQGNPRGYTVEHFRYPGHPPQSRETAILAICDAVEAASRTLNKPDAAAIDSLVQRIVYGKLHLGQLDESGLSMADLRRISDSLRETIRHANHGRIAYPWQNAGQDASASTSALAFSATAPRLDSLDRRPGRDTKVRAAIAAASAPAPADRDPALAATADLHAPEPAREAPSDAATLATGTAPTMALGPEPDLDNAITNPPPVRRGAGEPAAPDPAQLASALAELVSRVNAAPFVGEPVEPAAAEPGEPRRELTTIPGIAGPVAQVTIRPRRPTARPATPAPQVSDARPALPDLDASFTEPSLPVLAVGDEHQLDVPLRPAPPAAPARRPGWSSGLAARIDAALDDEEGALRTPIVPPTRAELRALAGHSDPTREQPLEEIARLHRRAAELDEEVRQRSVHPTTEVDPDDIEAAIELAPPARRPRKSE